MNNEQKIIRAKVGLLELASSSATSGRPARCWATAGCFYRFQELYEKGGELALQRSAAQADLHNRVRRDRGAVVALAVDEPAWGQIRVANELTKRGLSSPCRGALRLAAPGPGTMRKRLKALEAKAPRRPGANRGPTHGAREGQERKRGPRRVRKRVPRLFGRPGHLLRRQHEGGGPIYQQTFIDTYAKVALRQALRPQDPITAADLLNDRVLPFYARARLRCRVSPIAAPSSAANASGTTTSSTSPSRHDHTRTKTKRPRTNGICERFHKTCSMNSTGRNSAKKSITRSPNCRPSLKLVGPGGIIEARPHQGRWCFGKTPDADLPRQPPHSRRRNSSPPDHI